MTEQLALDTRSRIDAICDLIANDPLHRADKEAIVRAIRDTAAENRGIVDQNLVRPLIPNFVYHKVIGPTYNQLRRVGVLKPIVREDGTPLLNRSDDNGRWQPLDRWVGEL